MPVVIDLNQAVAIARKLEGIAEKLGAHVALGGGVLINGSSEKDMDLIVYPHDKAKGLSMHDILTAFGSVEVLEHKYSDGKAIFITETCGVRVDLFFLS